MSASNITTASILALLNNRHFLKQVKSVSGFEFEAEISLNLEATEVFIRHLNISARLKHEYNYANAPQTEIIVSLTDEEIDFVADELDFAYQKAIQYLDYKDLRKEYASGYVPLFASDWLIHDKHIH